MKRTVARADHDHSEEELTYRAKPTHLFRISTYRLFISHKYAHADQYRRLVAMLDRAKEHDPAWHWKNVSVPSEKPIMTSAEASQAETYIARIRERLRHAHAILFIGTDEWLDDAGSVYLELTETTPRYRFDIPVITVVPRGTALAPGRHVGPGAVAVRWHLPAIIGAVRAHAIPAYASEVRLSSAERLERAAIVSALRTHSGRLRETARALGMSPTSLRKKRMEYLIL